VLVSPESLYGTLAMTVADTQSSPPAAVERADIPPSWERPPWGRDEPLSTKTPTKRRAKVSTRRVRIFDDMFPTISTEPLESLELHFEPISGSLPGQAPMAGEFDVGNAVG
jgi:hypothetical protein